LASFLDPRFKEQNLSYKEGTKQQIIDQFLQYYQAINVHESSENPTTSDLQVLYPAKRLKGLAAVLQHITEDQRIPLL